MIYRQKLDSLTYISAAKSVGVSSTAFTYNNPPRKLPNSVKLRGGYDYYAVQGHLRSPSLVPIENSYAASY